MGISFVPGIAYPEVHNLLHTRCFSNSIDIIEGLLWVTHCSYGGFSQDGQKPCFPNAQSGEC